MRIFSYIHELDAFKATDEYREIANDLGLAEWNPVVWIGRLISMDNDYGEHWFDNWNAREERASAAKELGIDPDELLVVESRRFEDRRDGPCNSDAIRGRFWHEIVRQLDLSAELLFEKARDLNGWRNTLDERVASVRLRPQRLRSIQWMPCRIVAAAITRRARQPDRLHTMAVAGACLIAGLLVTTSESHGQEIENRIVFRDSVGRELTLDDLREYTGTARWAIEGDWDVPEPARRLHQEGRHAGGSGDYERALMLFKQASALAPAWPYPVYDAAFTHLLRGDFATALVYYRRTVELAPRGFFTALTAVDALEREEAGTLPAGTYLAYTRLEWIDDTEEKEALVRELLVRVAGFAPAWKELALLLDDDVARDNAIEQGLAANPDPETRAILLINRAITLFNRGRRDQAVAILGSLALDPNSSEGAAAQAKATLALLLLQKPQE